MKKRDDYIDIYKGILIIIVIVGHDPAGFLSLTQLIYSFHMIAFFSAYGLSYDLEKHSQRLDGPTDLWSFIAGKAKRIALPYLIWAFIYNTPTLSNIFLILYGSSQSLTIAGGLSSLWYLSCMFIAVILFEIYVFFIGKRLKETVFKLIGTGLFSLVMIIIGFKLSAVQSGFLLFDPELGYPWGLKPAFMVCGFMGITWIINKLFKQLMSVKYSVCIFIITCVCSAYIVYSTYLVNMENITIARHVAVSKAIYGDPILFILDSICGIICILSASIVIDKLFADRLRFIKNIFCTLGINTMGIYLVHKPIVQRFGRMAVHRYGHDVKWLVVTVIITLIISYILNLLIRHVLPELIGEKRKEKQSKAL